MIHHEFVQGRIPDLGMLRSIPLKRHVLIRHGHLATVIVILWHRRTCIAIGSFFDLMGGVHQAADAWHAFAYIARRNRSAAFHYSFLGDHVP